MKLCPLIAKLFPCVSKVGLTLVTAIAESKHVTEGQRTAEIAISAAWLIGR